MSDDRPVRYLETGEHGERVIYRMSGLLMCQRIPFGLDYGIEPAPVPKHIQAGFDRGHDHEEKIIARILERGPELLDTDPFIGRGQCVVHEVDGSRDELMLRVGEINGRDVWLRGHVDGIGVVSVLQVGGTTSREKAVVEAKYLGPDYWKRFLASGLDVIGKYPWQVSAYSHATGLPVLFVAAQRDDSKPDGIGDIKAQWIQEPPVSLWKIKAQIARYENHIAAGKMPECDKAEYPCPMFGTICGSAEARVARENQRTERIIAEKGTFEIEGELKNLVSRWVMDKQVEQTNAGPYNKAKKAREETGRKIIAKIDEMEAAGKVGTVKICGEEFTVEVKREYVEPQPYTKTVLNIKPKNNKSRKKDGE